MSNCYRQCVVCTCSCRSADADARHRSLNAGGVVSTVPLPCGGYAANSSSSFSSVYRAAGPVLYNVTVTVSHTTVFTGQPLELMATAHSHTLLTVPLGQFL